MKKFLSVIVMASVLLLSLASNVNCSYPTLDKESVRWLSLNIYHEASGEPIKGKQAVAFVTLNRLKDPEFPKTIKGVVTQRDMFSWYNKKKKIKTPKDKKTWELCEGVAKSSVMMYEASRKPPLQNALWFHKKGKHPKWAKSYKKVVAINNHVFYKRKNNS